MASKGDYSLYAKLYGLTPGQLELLQGRKGAGTGSAVFGEIVGDVSDIVKGTMG